MRQVIGNFLNYLAVEKGFSPNTIAAYRNDLNQLASFVEEEATKRGTIPPWASFDRQSMLSYLLDLRQRNYAATTVARKVAAARSFFNFMVAEGKMGYSWGTDKMRPIGFDEHGNPVIPKLRGHRT